MKDDASIYWWWCTLLMLMYLVDCCSIWSLIETCNIMRYVKYVQIFNRQITISVLQLHIRYTQRNRALTIWYLTKIYNRALTIWYLTKIYKIELSFSMHDFYRQKQSRSNDIDWKFHRIVHIYFSNHIAIKLLEEHKDFKIQ